MESVEESSHTMTEIDTANNIIIEHAYSEEHGANSSIIHDDPGDSSSSSSLESPIYEPTTVLAPPTLVPDLIDEPVVEPNKEEPPKPEVECTKVNRELKNLLDAAKESNLDTNIVHKRESRKSMDPFGTKPTQDPNSGDKDTKMAGIQRKDGLVTPKTPKGRRDNFGDSPLGAASGDEVKKYRKAPSKIDILAFNNMRKDKDNFCWRCHREGVLVQCETCPRSYHSRCLKHNVTNPERWPCPECLAILQAESTKTRSPAMRDMSLEHLCELLKYAVKRMISCAGSEPFIHPVDLNLFPDYQMYVVQPMDLTTIQNNIRNNVYGSTDAFLADAKWILHNSIIYNSYQSKLTTAAKSILKICKQEMSEIETCAECYQNANTKKNSWFVEVCSKPHILLWAKLKGFPYWPAKAMTTNLAGLVDVRFFGAHDRAWIPIKECFLYSKKDPNPNNTKKRSNIAECIKEVDIHIEKLKVKFGEFYFAPYRTPYDPNTELEQLSFMLPRYKPGVRSPFVKTINVKSENGDDPEKPLDTKTPRKRGRSPRVSDSGSFTEKKPRSRTPSTETPQSIKSDFDEMDLMSSSKSSLGSDKMDKRNLFTQEFDKFMEGYGTEDDDMPLSLNTELRKKMIMSDSESDEELSKTSSQEDQKNGESDESGLLRGKVRTRGGCHNIRRKRSNNSPTLFDSPVKLFRRNSDISTKSDSSRMSGISDKINRVDEFPDNSELNLSNITDAKSKDGFTTPDKLKPVVLSAGDLYNKNKEFRISPQSKQSIADRLMKKISESETTPDVEQVKKQILDNLEATTSIASDITDIVSSELLSNIFEPTESPIVPEKSLPETLFDNDKSPEFLHLVGAVEPIRCDKIVKMSVNDPKPLEKDPNESEATEKSPKQLETEENLKAPEIDPVFEKDQSVLAVVKQLENELKQSEVVSDASKDNENDPTGFDKYLKDPKTVQGPEIAPKVAVKEVKPLEKEQKDKVAKEEPKKTVKTLTSFEKYLKGCHNNPRAPEKELKGSYKIPKLSEKDPKPTEKDLKPSEKESKPSEKDTKPSEKDLKPSEKDPKPTEKDLKEIEKNLKEFENDPKQPNKDSEKTPKRTDPSGFDKYLKGSERDPRLQKETDKDVKLQKDLKETDKDLKESEKDVKESEKDLKPSEKDQKLKDSKGTDRYPKRSARAPPKAHEIYAKMSENDPESDKDHTESEASTKRTKPTEKDAKPEEKVELRSSKRLEKLKISSSTESDDDKPLKKISELIKSSEEPKNKAEVKIIETKTVAQPPKARVPERIAEDKSVAEKQLEEMEIDSEELSDYESDSDEPIMTRQKKSLVKLVNVSDIISGKINNKEKVVQLEDTIEIKSEPVSEDDASPSKYSVTLTRVDKPKIIDKNVDNVTSVINDVASNYNKMEEKALANRKEITLRPISKLIQSPKQKARKSFPNSPHKMQTMPIQIKKMVPDKKEAPKPPTMALKMVSSFHNLSTLQTIPITTTHIPTNNTATSSKESMVYIAPQPPSNPTLIQPTPLLAMVQATQPGLIYHGPPVPPLAPVPSTSQCAVVNASSMDTSSPPVITPAPNLIDAVPDDRSLISDTIAKAVGDLLCRQPPKLKPKPPGPMAVLFDEGAPSSAGPTTKLINSVAHRFTDYFRGLLRETLEDLSSLGNPESKIRTLELEIESLKQKHSEEMLELRKNISSILKDIQKSIVEEKAKIVDETRAVCEAERVRCVEEAKAKQWCAYCLKEARFYCCWNTSYCDYPCQQKHWATHMKTCSQSSVRAGAAGTSGATDKSGLAQSNKQMPKHTYTNNTKSVVKQTRMIVKQTTNKQGLNMFSPVQRGIQPGQQTITLVESTPGNFEIVGNHGPISLGGKLVPATTIKVKPGNMLTVASTSTSSTSTVTGSQKAIIVSQKPAPMPKVTSAPAKDTNAENKT